MKLRNPEDKALFLTEVDRLDLVKKDDVDEELFELFLKRRTPLVKKMKDFRKSQRSKRMWANSRWKIMTGIRSFHKSVAGKRFHRNLGRFIATRIFRPLVKQEHLEHDVFEHLKALSSVRTHIYIESGYFMKLDDDIEFQEFSEYAIPLVNNVEQKLFEDVNYIPTKDETELLIRIVDLDTLFTCIEDLTNTEVKQRIERLIKQNSEVDATLLYTNTLLKVQEEYSEQRKQRKGITT